MASLKQQLSAAIVLAIAGVGAGAASAQDKDRIVTERQEAMKQQGREMVAVRNYFQNKGDQAAAIAAMDGLQKSLPRVPDWFPPGTGIGEVSVKTRAKPEIWQEHDKFLAADKTVIGLVAQLDTAVRSGDKAKVEAAFNEVKFCAACHDSFRAPER
jgi:cytochrome c556